MLATPITINPVISNNGLADILDYWQSTSLSQKLSLVVILFIALILPLSTLVALKPVSGSKER